jgi:hypothetical protein
MKVSVEIYTEQMYSYERERAIVGDFTFVALMNLRNQSQYYKSFRRPAVAGIYFHHVYYEFRRALPAETFYFYYSPIIYSSFYKLSQNFLRFKAKI